MQQKSHLTDFNPFIHYNENNWGVARLRDKYPDESDDQIAVRVLGRSLRIPKEMKQ